MGDEAAESGPFCRHWSDPSDCERPCARCGHACSLHGVDVDARPCEAPVDPAASRYDVTAELCACEDWLEPED